MKKILDNTLTYITLSTHAKKMKKHFLTWIIGLFLLTFTSQTLADIPDLPLKKDLTPKKGLPQNPKTDDTLILPQTKNQLPKITTYPYIQTPYKEKRSTVLNVLKESVFGNDTPPQSLANGQVTTYDPMYLAIVSSMYSRLPERDDSQYNQVNLPPISDSNYRKVMKYSDVCPNPIKAFVKLSKQKNPHTFILLPGAYATWKRGSFNNQTISALENHFNDPNIISFAGYLSPAFLEGVCDEIPWDALSIARDLYSRLRVYLNTINSNPFKTGVIGFSGGGGLAIELLATDSQTQMDQRNTLHAELESQTKENRLFGLGGAVFSPTLHGRVIFHNLDTAISEIEHTKALTTIGFKNIVFMALAHRDLKMNWEDIIDYYEYDPQDFLERAFNEFTHVDLADTLKAVGVDPLNINGELSYYNAYVNTGFRETLHSALQTEIEAYQGKPVNLGGMVLPEGELDTLYDKETNIKPALDQIDRPLTIYLSQDDPVLSSYNAGGQPQAITEILKSAGKNPAITVFNPKYGGHIGVFLDPIFEDLIQAVFTKDKKTFLEQLYN